MLAALAAGNAVILKPAPEARAHGAAPRRQQLHRAGVPRDVVQFVACPDNEVGRHLVTHPDVDSVILTGAYETAQLFRVVEAGDAPARRDERQERHRHHRRRPTSTLAIRDLVRSAFGHAGQKCSAASLAIVEASLYDDPSFMDRLADATRSLRVGPADRPGAASSAR